MDSEKVASEIESKKYIFKDWRQTTENIKEIFFSNNKQHTVHDRQQNRRKTKQT